MTYIAFFLLIIRHLLQFFNASSLFLLSVVDSFNFPLFLRLALSVLHMGVELMGFCHSCLSGGDLSHRLVQNGPFPPVSPSFVNLPVERLRPSESFRSCYHLCIAPDLERWLILIFSMVDENLFPLIHSPPAAHIFFFFSLSSQGFSESFTFVIVCVCVCMCVFKHLSIFFSFTVLVGLFISFHC